MSDEHHDYRGYAGRVASGIWQAGDEVVVLPSGLRSRVEAVESSEGPLEAAVPPMSVTLRLADDVDVSRGNMLADPARPPVVAREVEARVCWMSERLLEPRAKIGVKHTTRTVRGLVEELVSVVDIHTLNDVASPASLALNDIGIVRLRLSEPRDRRVHPHRRGDERHRRCRDDRLRQLMTWQFALAGLLIGSIVGLTGMGGGSLMTPILVIVFGFQPTYAVGTDIVHGAIFKSFGAVRHRRLGTVHARLTLWMFLGSGPLSLAGVGVAALIKHHYGDSAQSIESYAVGGALVAGGLGFLAKSFIKRGIQPSDAPFILSRRDKVIAVLIGAVFGFVVGLTSVGSGTFFGLVMVLVYPLTMSKIVGTDIFHAAALLWVAGIGHLISGNVDLHATAWLLVGSIPGVLISSRFTVRLPDLILRISLGTILLLSGLKLLNVPQAQWILLGGLVALGLGLTAYGLRAWLTRPRAAASHA
jgi:hypothetical protein